MVTTVVRCTVWVKGDPGGMSQPRHPLLHHTHLHPHLKEELRTTQPMSPPHQSAHPQVNGAPRIRIFVVISPDNCQIESTVT